jgi:hypothetical protein
MKFTNLGRQARTVTLNDLKLGDCFLFDNRIGMVASRNGHDFPLDLSTGKEFYAVPPAREWIPHDRPAMLAPSAEVVRISAELVYKILD